MFNDKCLFIVNNERCLNNKHPFSIFCEKHKNYFKSFDNKSLLNNAAQYFRNVIYVNENKKIGVRANKNVWANFTNCMNELAARGYKYDDM